MFTMSFASIVLVEDHAILGEGLRAQIDRNPVRSGAGFTKHPNV